MKQENSKKGNSLAVLFGAIIFASTILALFLTVVITAVLYGCGVDTGLVTVLIIFAIISAVIAYILGKKLSDPINGVALSLKDLAKGKFNVRIDGNIGFAKNESIKDVTEDFNTVAKELEGTELLRSEFVKDFSAQFKEPLTKITEAAGAMKESCKADSEKLSLISDNADALEKMAANVMNMTQLENQSILYGASKYSLSDQLESVCKELGEKAAKKSINMALNIGNFDVEANSDLLKQAWINLIDNAIKFSEEKGTVKITVIDKGENLAVSVGNTGSYIAPDQLDLIFQKFYKIEKDHGKDGNGIGLAIVKRVTDLHKGTVTVTSQDGYTEFTVSVPKIQ